MAACESKNECATKMKPAVVVPCSKAQSARKVLEAHGLWDKTRKLQKHDGDNILIPVNTADVTVLSLHLHETKDPITIIQADLLPSKSERLVTPAQLLLKSTSDLLNQFDSLVPVKERLLLEVPSHWEKHGDLVLLPASAFQSSEWSLLGQELWQTVAKCTGARRVARQSVVSSDGFRSPQVTLLLGDSAVVQHVDNAIKYKYDLTRCMFSAGNITEKLRVAKFDCKGETVVDLYAGIGYFTLPYLVHAGASHVHACEWNPEAVAALQRNLELNHVNTRCTVHPGDNRQLKMRGVADRVNLGLIPSSEEGWPVACRVLKPTGGIMHVHGNVNSQTAEGEKHPIQLGAETSAVTSLNEVDDKLPHVCVNKGTTVQGTQVDSMQTFLEGESQDQSVKETPQSMALTDGYDAMDGLLAKTDEGAENVLRDFDEKSDNEKRQHRGNGTDREGLTEGDVSPSTPSQVIVELWHRRKEQPHSACYAYTQVKTEPCRRKEDKIHGTSDHFSLLNHSSSHPKTGSEPEKHEQPCAGSVSQMSQKSNSMISQTSQEWCDGSAHDHQSSQTSQDWCDGYAQGHLSSPSSKTAAWQMWGENVCISLKTLLEKEHGGSWLVTVLHIEPVKSYAPHVHHVVLDIQCTPTT